MRQETRAMDIRPEEICPLVWWVQIWDFFCFSIGQWPKTPPGFVRAVWQRRRAMECCIRWPGLHNHPTSTQLRWFGMSWNADWRKSSQQVLSICGNSFKTVGEAFQVKLIERIPRVCKAVIKAKVAILILNTFLVSTWFHMCYFIVLMSSLLFYNVENSTNVWLVLYCGDDIVGVFIDEADDWGDNTNPEAYVQLWPVYEVCFSSFGNAEINHHTCLPLWRCKIFFIVKQTT